MHVGVALQQPTAQQQAEAKADAWVCRRSPEAEAMHLLRIWDVAQLLPKIEGGQSLDLPLLSPNIGVGADTTLVTANTFLQ